MHRNTIAIGLFVAFASSAVASASISASVGTIKQILPRPTIEYQGAFGAHITSRVDASGARTISSLDLFGIATQLGGNLSLVGLRIYDTGANTYGSWSPGADIDLVRIVGGATDGSMSCGYTGIVAQHLGEAESVIAARVAECDAVSGDQHYNSQHFLSLGLGGAMTMAFNGYYQGSTGGSGSSSGGAGGGPGSWTGGSGESSGTPIYGGMLVVEGMRLEIGEAGTGESYGVELVFEQAAVPAPGAIALLGLAGLMARRRR